MTGHMEYLEHKALNRMLETWDAHEDAWVERIETPNAMIHYNKDGSIQRVQLGESSEHISAEHAVNLGDMR